MHKNSKSSSTRSSGELKVFDPHSDEESDQKSSKVKSNSLGMTLRQLPRVLSRSFLVQTERDDDFFRAEDIEDGQLRDQSSITIENGKATKEY